MSQSDQDLIAQLRLENKSLREENRELKAVIAELQERVDLLTQMLFGSSSEKFDHLSGAAKGGDQAQEEDTSAANDADDSPDPQPPGGSDPKDPKTRSRSRGKNSKKGKGGGRNKLPPHLLRIYRELDYKKLCHCGAILRVIKQHTVEKLAVMPAFYYVIAYIHTHTACPCCDDAISCTQAEPSLIPNSQATPELLAHIAISKTADALPIYRQEKQADRNECPISREKLNRWFIQLGLALTPLLKFIVEAYNSYHIGGIDETRLQVIKEPGKTAQQLSYLFIRYGGPPNKRVMLVDYEQNKNQQTVNKLLELFEGKAIISDMASAFIAFVKSSINITLYACHDHARRKFTEALKLIPKANRQGSFASEVLEIYKELYAIEALAKGRSPYVIKKLRRRSRKVLNRLFRKLEAACVTPKSKLGKAIHYAIEHKKALYAYLDNPLAPISNIKTEHIAKMIAVARKNFLFCYSVQGAEALANIMTLVYTAQLYPEHNLQNYLTIVFQELPKAKTLEELEALLPWNLTPDEVNHQISLRPRPDLSAMAEAA